VTRQRPGQSDQLDSRTSRKRQVQSSPVGVAHGTQFCSKLSAMGARHHCHHNGRRQVDATRLSEGRGVGVQLAPTKDTSSGRAPGLIPSAAKPWSTLAVPELSRWVGLCLRTFGLRQYFDVVMGGDMVGCGELDLVICRLAAGRLSVPPAKCLVVEDAPTGITAGLATGMLTLAVDSPYTTRVLTADAHIQASSLEEGDIVRWLCGGCGPPSPRECPNDRSISKGAPDHLSWERPSNS
jgi:Haloacid dehalogenase-like hydrolase